MLMSPDIIAVIGYKIKRRIGFFSISSKALIWVGRRHNDVTCSGPNRSCFREMGAKKAKK